jgi:hypothetical protein
MPFYCGSMKSGHQHDTVHEAKVCVGLIRPTPASGPLGLATPAQVGYVVDGLGGDRSKAEKMTRAECSRYIDQLKKEKYAKPAPAAPAYTPRPSPTTDPRLPMVEGLIDLVPEGYYAVKTEFSPYRFVYFSRPKRGKHAGSLKFSEQIGAVGRNGRYEIRAEKWQSGRWSLYERTFLDQIMLIITDHQTAAQAYARETRRCCRCNARLTDERSRWYGIGPECEEYWPWMIDRINDSDKGRYRAGVS